MRLQHLVIRETKDRSYWVRGEFYNQELKFSPCWWSQTNISSPDIFPWQPARCPYVLKFVLVWQSKSHLAALSSWKALQTPKYPALPLCIILISLIVYMSRKTYIQICCHMGCGRVTVNISFVFWRFWLIPCRTKALLQLKTTVMFSVPNSTPSAGSPLPPISLANVYLSFMMDWKANFTPRNLFRGNYQGQLTFVASFLCAEPSIFIRFFNSLRGRHTWWPHFSAEKCVFFLS